MYNITAFLFIPLFLVAVHLRLTDGAAPGYIIFPMLFATPVFLAKCSDLMKRNKHARS